MAHYDITHTCGHTARVNLVGPHSSREWRLARLREEVCRDCWQEQEHSAATALAAAQGLPAWTAGTPAQRQWAESIRVTLLDRLEMVYCEHLAKAALSTPEQIEQVTVLYTVGRAALIEERTDAKWWIDHREDMGTTLLRLALAQGLSARPDLAPPEMRPTPTPTPTSATSPQSPSVTPSTPITPVTPAYIVRPETPLSQTIATLVYEADGERLVMRYPDYHEQMRDVMRSLDFTWSATERVWTRRLSTLPISERNPQDRLAEAATQLIAAGFIVRLRDAAAHERALTQTFHPERRRWVRVMTAKDSAYHGWLSLSWPRSDDLYAAAKQLRGARFHDGRTLVPPGSADEIEEFARVYEFVISDKAQAALNEVRDSLAHGAVLTPVKTKRHVRRSGDGAVPVSATPPVLPVPEDVAVAEALRDDI